ncbi:hypothetical protein [Chitinophaga vietnamensis]|uniref:hypothetical protein n=1 Tax=Chitinophaga vietnamensis TaxID=2593957 RepID=UPI00117766D0|nr:hypothetical protein [Chitinophaga vietnamensis]
MVQEEAKFTKNDLLGKQEQSEPAELEGSFTSPGTTEAVKTKKIADSCMLAAMGLLGVSAILFCAGKKHLGLFTGQLVAPLLLFGIYHQKE